MKRWTWTFFLAAVLAAAGCHPRRFLAEPPSDSYLPVQQEIEYPDVSEASFRQGDLLATPPPPSVRRPQETPKWPLTLEEVIQLTLQNSRVIRDLGGRVVSSPASVPTVFDPAIQETDPRQGVEAALSAFDADFTTSLFFDRQDRAFNNAFQGAGANERSSQLADFQFGVTKTAPTGTQFALESLTNYNRNILPRPDLDGDPGTPNFLRFNSAYDTVLQGSFRHPLLQGAGIEFNRIAGPQATPGNYNGVLLARLNTDVTLADFEAAVRNLLRDVEQTYWELYFAYRDLDAKREGRQLALETWRLENRLVNAGKLGHPPDQEAFVRQQFYAAQSLMESTLTGRSNGTGGVYAVERELRRLAGLPPTDGRVIVPVSEPVRADVQFDWSDALANSLMRRVEVRRQKWQIKRREYELVAARNFQRMRMDFVGEYRWRGFGDHLFGTYPEDRLSAFQNLFHGDLQEWRFGLELTTPVGNRIGHTAVRNAELQLMREQSLLNEMERQIVLDLRAAFTELDRAYVVSRSNYNRRVATFIRLQAEKRRNEASLPEEPGANGAPGVRLLLLLDAQRQAVESEIEFFRALVDYNLALMNLNYARGTLLDSHGIYLTEGPWSDTAHRSAAKEARRFRPRTLTNYCLAYPPHVSRGSYPQRLAEVPASLPPAETGPPRPELIPPGQPLPTLPLPAPRPAP